MKGIVLAGGSGTRLHPITLAVSKQLLPIYDKPMIYYPLSTLIQAGITEILIITTPHDQEQFKRLLGDGSQWNIQLEYAIQETPRGLADAFIVGRDFIGNDSCALILGDNLFYGPNLPELLQDAVRNNKGATIFAYQVSDPERYGVVEFDSNGLALSLEEKPKNPRSNWAVTGLYIYDNRVADISSKLQFSERGELEITDINRQFHEWNELSVKKLDSSHTWLDTGTHDSLFKAAELVRSLKTNQGKEIACPEKSMYLMNHFK